MVNIQTVLVFKNNGFFDNSSSFGSSVITSLDNNRHNSHISDVGGFRNWLVKLEECGHKKVVLECPSCGKTHTQTVFCYNHACRSPQCLELRRFRVRRKITHAVKEAVKIALSNRRRLLKFITLTYPTRLRTKEQKKQYDRMAQRFARELGFVGVIVHEAKDKGEGWHYHHHLVGDCPYTLQKTLQKKWHSMGGGILYIKAFSGNSPEGILLYASKLEQRKQRVQTRLRGSSFAVGELEYLRQYYDVFYRGRLFAVVGNFVMPALPAPVCPSCGASGLVFMGYEEDVGMFLEVN